MNCDLTAQLGELLCTLERLQSDERAAVSTLDATALVALAGRKQTLLLQLRALLLPDGDAAARAGPALAELRRLARPVALRIAAEATANAALLTDAIRAIADALGGREPAATYDRRARPRHTARVLSQRRA